jgi:hypothetical protein
LFPTQRAIATKISASKATSAAAMPQLERKKERHFLRFLDKRLKAADFIAMSSSGEQV